MAREVTKHGMSGYRAGCHCEVCRMAKRDYMRGWRAEQRKAKAELAGAEQPALDVDVDAPVPAPVAAAGALDMDCPPGPLEQAFLDDISEPDARVAFRRHLVGIGRLNARVLDQISALDRLDLVSPVQLRQLEVLGRLAILGFAGMDDDGRDRTGESLAADAEQMLRTMAEGGPGGAAG